ncbi:hypothetical protein IP84_09950 [beta proteobacterium AAP99]|nr:hypothetical protein IP84_09950 [beta proteobacterium AAP99]
MIANKKGTVTGVVLGYSFDRTFEVEFAQRKASRLIAGMADVSVRYVSRPETATAIMLQWVRPMNDYVGLGLRAGVVRASRRPGNVFGSGTSTGNSLVLGVTGRLMLSKNIAIVVGLDRTSDYANTDIPLTEYRAGIRGYF